MRAINYKPWKSGWLIINLLLFYEDSMVYFIKVLMFYVAMSKNYRVTTITQTHRCWCLSSPWGIQLAPCRPCMPWRSLTFLRSWDICDRRDTQRWTGAAWTAHRPVLERISWTAALGAIIEAKKPMAPSDQSKLTRLETTRTWFWFQRGAISCVCENGIMFMENPHGIT